MTWGKEGRSDSPRISRRAVVYATEWFEVVAKTVDLGRDPFYCIQMSDYVTIVATTPAEEFVLVRQFRPALEQDTVELPSGHVDAGVSPEEAARQELREETGYEAAALERLAVLNPDTGRLANRMWCYRARDVVPVGAGWRAESGIVAELCSRRELFEHIRDGRFDHALHLAALLFVLTDESDPKAKER
jgi:ADP-ribose pyrophosphatase